MWIRATCNLEFQLEDSTPMIFMLRPRSGMQQWVAREAYTISPIVPVEEYTDIFGNLCQRMVAPAGSFSVHTTADVMTADVADQAPGAFFVEIQNLPDAVLSFYCQADTVNRISSVILREASSTVRSPDMTRCPGSTTGPGIRYVTHPVPALFRSPLSR